MWNTLLFRSVLTQTDSLWQNQREKWTSVSFHLSQLKIYQSAAVLIQSTTIICSTIPFLIKSELRSSGSDLHRNTHGFYTAQLKHIP